MEKQNQVEKKMQELEIVKTIFPNIMEALIAIKKGKIKNFIDILLFVNETIQGKKKGVALGLPSSRMLILKLLALPFGESDIE